MRAGEVTNEVRHHSEARRSLLRQGETAVCRRAGGTERESSSISVAATQTRLERTAGHRHHRSMYSSCKNTLAGWPAAMILSSGEISSTVGAEQSGRRDVEATGDAVMSRRGLLCSTSFESSSSDRFVVKDSSSSPRSPTSSASSVSSTTSAPSTASPTSSTPLPATPAQGSNNFLTPLRSLLTHLEQMRTSKSSSPIGGVVPGSNKQP